MNTLNNWGPAAIIVFGYIVGFYFQNKRFDDLYRYLEVRFAELEKRIDLRFEAIEHRLSLLEEKLGVKQS